VVTRVVRGAAERWWLYLLACSNGRMYAGIAVDVETRFAAHLRGKGARFTRANKPLKILAAEPFPDRASATRAESALKRLRRPGKLAWAERWTWRNAA